MMLTLMGIGLFASHAKEPSANTKPAEPTAPPISESKPTPKIEPAESGPVAVEQRDEFIRHGWSFSLPENEAGIVSALGPATKIGRRQVENKYTAGQMDESVELHYDGLLVGLYKGGGTEMFTEVLVTDSQHPVQHSLGVGTSADRITKLFGKPDEAIGDTLAYSTSLSGYEAVHFKISDGRIESIDWTKQIE